LYVNTVFIGLYLQNFEKRENPYFRGIYFREFGAKARKYLPFSFSIAFHLDQAIFDVWATFKGKALIVF